MQLQRNSKTREVFLFALLAAALIYLPFIVYNGGYFIYYGDFNVQQIPFYKLAHEAVRSGDIFWNWYTDLGVNFIGSYSFYLLTSPFFWLTLPFPTSWVPMLMGPLLMLKTACAALTAFLYLRRMVKNEQYAVIGAMLYAFSGWMTFNVFFNHFLEVAVFFPLLLLGVERLVTENKRGLFAATVLLNAVVNYWFFVGEAIFVVLYVLIRATDREWGLNVRKFLRIALEALLGFGAAMFVVLPSVMALIGNPRTGGDELLSGWNIWLYWHEQRYPAIIQSLLFPPELPARPNFLPDHGAKWASLSGWLPLFSVTGVLAYFFRRKNDWLKKILACSLLCAMVPALNSMFILFNHSYYARWFYMPVLLMALATARALEDADPEQGPRVSADYARAVKWTAILLVVFTAMSGLTPHYDEGGALQVGLADNLPLMWIFAGIAFVCLAAVAGLVLALRKNPRFSRFALAGVLVVSVAFSIFYISNGKNSKTRDDWLIEHAIQGGETVTLPESDTFARVDFYDALDNLGMYWHVPTIQAFHSIVPPSIMEFYPQVGVTRDVGSRPDTESYALRPLLSVRWLFIEEDDADSVPLPDFSYHSSQNGFALFENANFLPLGFAYDQYLTGTELEDFTESSRSHAMLRAVVLDDEAVARNADILYPLDGEGYLYLNEHTLAEDVATRRGMASDSVSIDRTGFTLTTDFTKERLLFVSVPYENGWSATVTAQDGSVRGARVERANIGFMAVRVPAGKQTVRFDYATPGLTTGLVVTGVCLLLLAVYLLVSKTLSQPVEGEEKPPREPREKAARKPREKKQKRNQAPAGHPPEPHTAPDLPEQTEQTNPIEQTETLDAPDTAEPGEPQSEPQAPVEEEPSLYFKAMPASNIAGEAEPELEPEPEPQLQTDTAPPADTPQPLPENEKIADEPPPENEKIADEPPPENEKTADEPPRENEKTADEPPRENEKTADGPPPENEKTADGPPQQRDNATETAPPPAKEEAADAEPERPQENPPETDAPQPPQNAAAAAAEEPAKVPKPPARQPKKPEPPLQAGLKRDARLRSPGAQKPAGRPVRRDPRTGKPVTGPRRDPRTGKPIPPRRDPKGPKD